MSLIIRGGRVIDPANGVDKVADVVIVGNTIERIVPPGTLPLEGAQIIDATGYLVTPGLIDLHTHVYAGGSPIGFDVEEHSFRDGVTTVVDGGTAGAYTIRGFLDSIIDRSDGRVFAFVNLSTIGIIHNAVGELVGMKYVDLAALERVLHERPDVLVGVKIRLSHRIFGGDVKLARTALQHALDVTARTGTRLMVHVIDPILPITEIFGALRSGDIATHAFHSLRGETIVDSHESFHAATAAQERGVVFDTGCGNGAMSFDVLRQSREQGLVPDTISSDLTADSVHGPVFGLTTTMSKVLATGVSLESVIAGVTVNAAKAIGRFPDTGTLTPGTRADLAVLSELEGDFHYENRNADGLVVDTVEAKSRIEPILGIRDGLPHVLKGNLSLRPTEHRDAMR